MVSHSSAARVGTADNSRKPTRTMSIGLVLERLRVDFPDVTVSKIRFLESEGLVTPKRTASGYRRFTEDDVERLRYILVTQRDHYLPLRVIREQLEAMDNGQMAAILAKPMVSAEKFRAPAMTRLTDTDVAQQADVDVAVVAELVASHLIHPDTAGFFTNDDVATVRSVVALESFGLDTRHLRSLRVAARRHADLISQVTKPIAHSKTDGASARAEETAQQVSALLVSLHASLLKNAMREGK